MAIEGKAIMAILTIKSIMAILAPILNGHKYEVYGCLKKEWPKCRSPVKTVIKKMDPMKSYEQNKKKFIREGFKKKKSNLGFWLKLGGRGV